MYEKHFPSVNQETDIKNVFALLLTTTIALLNWIMLTVSVRPLPTFECNWYISLKTKQEPSFELALLDATHETIPLEYRKNISSGLILNFEVEDVDAVYRTFKNANSPMRLEIRSEDFGQRHFITSDPNNILIDVIQVIPYSAEFASNT